ncbi:hypothetical protein WICMUC_002329 [Wickerhamomyces mucosus]|uniref:Uncharacterized protein n=1 Tax=Wickerhamomyces mucosus TaxID=1378264 RepID=A0A9P8PPH7_9ASCO|nr:hypothetical protein WICMUC_002329 [Wickerhamomyces mucosus]
MSYEDQDQDIELSKAPLYEIYENANLNDEDIESIPNSQVFTKLKVKSSESLTDNQNHLPKTHLTTFKIFKNFVILGNTGILFNKLSEQIHDNHILHKNLLNIPLTLTGQILKYLNVPDLVIFALQGIVFGSILPLLDYLIFQNYENVKRKKSFNDVYSPGSIIRSLIAFLGVAFAVRKIEWNSSIQASFAWTLLNPCLWLLLDSTISGFLTSLIGAIVASAILVLFGQDSLPLDWFHDYEMLAILLWLSNFFFFGLIIFGKIGRYLYQ